MPELHPDDLSNMPYSMANVPDFEKPIAQTSQLLPGDANVGRQGQKYQIVAHTPGTNAVYVDAPSHMTQPVLNHEVMHLIQNRQADRDEKAGLQPAKPVTAMDSSVYDYGGIDGLEAMQKKGRSLGHLNNEQQAQVLADYTSALQKVHSTTPEDFDRLNTVYGPLVRQMAEMAQPGNTINTTPAAPGPPPAALTGAMKPLPEIGGETENRILVKEHYRKAPAK